MPAKKTTLEHKRKLHKAWSDKNREKIRARQREWAKNNPRPSDRLKPWRLAKYEAKATRKKPTFCEACGTPEAVVGRTLCFDHDHATGLFRGWLCFNCNLVLGH